MDYASVYEKLGPHMAEEFQLLAEEKWILEALEKIKHQRNCLQIERLHLESMRAKMNKNTEQEQSIGQVLEVEFQGETSTANSMQNATASSEKNEAVDKPLDDVTVNDEELDLAVNNDDSDKHLNPDIDVEEEEDDNDDEEDSDGEEESDDDMLIDINMLMNGAPPSGRH